MVKKHKECKKHQKMMRNTKKSKKKHQNQNKKT